MSTGLTGKLRVLESSPLEVTGQYKPSNYNHFVARGDAVWGVNFLSGAFLRLSADGHKKVLRVLDGDAGDDLKTVRSTLVDQRFLVPEGFDELDLLKVRNRCSRFGSHGLTLIVAPTLRCNFGCEYCYVDRNANKMKPENRLKLARFFDRKLPEGTRARVVWTGGDPSLAMDVVEELSQAFVETCERKDCGYEASLITNGYLLHQKMRAQLRSSKIQSLQISLDGSEEFHNRSRRLPNGTPTYDRILDNVADTCDELRIYLRINVDTANHSAVPDLLDDLERRNLKERIVIYFAHVDDVNENSAGYHNSCLSVRDYAAVEASLVRSAIHRGFRLGGRILSGSIKTYCSANSQNSFVVDPNCILHKCYHYFGQTEDHGIGHIGDDGAEAVTNPHNLFKWLGWDPFEAQECRECKVLPLCMGGCSDKIMSSGFEVEPGCLTSRFSLNEIVQLWGEIKTDQVQSNGCSRCAVAARV